RSLVGHLQQKRINLSQQGSCFSAGLLSQFNGFIPLPHQSQDSFRRFLWAGHVVAPHRWSQIPEGGPILGAAQILHSLPSALLMAISTCCTALSHVAE